MEPRESISVWCYVLDPPRVLLVHRVPARAPGWQPVTGRLEPGESPLHACAREATEEAGLPAPLDVRPLGHVHEFTGYDGARYRQTAYAAKYAHAQPPRISPEHDDARWATPDEARAILRWDTDRETLALLEAAFL